MNQQVSSLIATFKNVSAFGTKYAADFPAASMGGQQFAIVTAAVTSTASHVEKHTPTPRAKPAATPAK